MNKEKMATMRKEKMVKLLPQSFITLHERISADEAKKELIKSEFNIKGEKEAMSEDDELKKAQDMVKELKAEYMNVIKLEQAKVAFFLDKIRENGGSPKD